ncbi:MAG: hypothetical protein A2020_13245 [Lentisphaerae bacterium GWF2_45_14]|nr:MAG: hypothetical protein A2020_13245 [Lentisphaerae bacterium GWF2_45_14]
MRYEYSGILKTLTLVTLGLSVVIVFAVRPLRESVSRFSMDFLFPYLKTPTEVELKVNKGGLYLKSKINLVADIEKLKATNLKLAAKAADASIFENENRQLRTMLRIQGRTGFTPVQAGIMTRDPISWDETFVIDKGSDDGLIPGALVLAPVLSGDNGFSEAATLSVVGRIKTASSRSAIVSSIVDENCKLSVRLPESSSAGIVNGGLRKGKEYFLKISYLPKDISYKKGEPVFTSGFSDSVPAAFFVGRIRDDSDIKIKDNLYKEIFIVSPVNFGELDFVMVMVKGQK